jgi:hypothetical protein
MLRKGRETHQDQIMSLARGQEGMIILVGRHLLEDDARSPGELDEAPFVISVLRILFARLSREFCGAQPVLEVLVRIPKVLARLVSKLGNGRRTSLPLYTGVPDLPPLSIGMRTPSISVRTGLAGRGRVSGAGADDLDGAWGMVIVWGIGLVLVLWLGWLMVRLRCKLVVTGGVCVWGMACAHAVGRIDQSDSPLSCCDG